MIIKIFLGLIVVILLFCIYVSSRPGKFRYERSGVIAASPDKIFPYLNDFKKGMEWSSYEKIDPALVRKYSGPESGVGAIEEFDGNRDVGSGRLEILKEIPNSLVQVKLDMYKPFKAANFIDYTLTPEGAGTRLSYAMSGEGGFMGKLMAVIIDCEKMIGDKEAEAIQNLKTLVETKK